MDRERFFDERRFRDLLSGAGLDAALAVSPENVSNTARLHNWDIHITPDRLHLTLWLADVPDHLIAFQRGRSVNTPQELSGIA